MKQWGALAGFQFRTRWPLRPTVIFPPLWFSQIQCHAVTQREPGQSLGSAGARERVMGNPPATRADLSLPYFLCKPSHTCSSQVQSKLPTALLSVSAVLPRVCLLGPQDWGIRHAA